MPSRSSGGKRGRSAITQRFVPMPEPASAPLAEPRRGHVYLACHPRNMPVPRLRWEWDGPDYSWIVAEISCKWSDPVVGVTWELPTSLSRRLDFWARAGRPLWGDRPLPFVTAVLVVWLGLLLWAVLAR